MPHLLLLHHPLLSPQGTDRPPSIHRIPNQLRQQRKHESNRWIRSTTPFHLILSQEESPGKHPPAPSSLIQSDAGHTHLTAQQSHQDPTTSIPLPPTPMSLHASMPKMVSMSSTGKPCYGQYGTSGLLEADLSSTATDTTLSSSSDGKATKKQASCTLALAANKETPSV